MAAQGPLIEIPGELGFAPAERDRQLTLAAIDWVRAVLEGGAASEARAQLDAVRAGTALDLLSLAFDLTPADEDCLCFSLAHRIDGGIAELCARAVGDGRQSYVTAHLLALAIGDGTPAFAAALFGRLVPTAPLRRWALVEVREAHALAAITLAERVALRLSGTACDGLAPGCVQLPLAPAPERFEQLAPTLVPQLTKGLALIGPAGSGRRELAALVAETAGLTAVLLQRRALPDGQAEREEVLREIACEARLEGLAVVIDCDPEDDLHQAAACEEGPMVARSGAAGRGLVRDALAILEGDLIALARDPTGLPAELHRERLPALQSSERKALWQACLDGAAPAEEMAAVAQHFPLAPGDIQAIADGIESSDPPGTLWQRCRGRGGGGLEALAQRVVPRFGWSDLILPTEILEDLQAIANQLRHRGTVYDTWGFGGRLTGGRGITALLAGPSGVGKSMAAEVIAGELGLDLYKVDLSRLVSKYIGDTEKNLRRVFDAAEDSGACLFLDEADACLGKRSEVKDSHDRHANIEVSYLLQRVESCTGLCLLATNLKSNLDGAFLRRLRFIVDLPFPSPADRLRIWQGAFPAHTPTCGLDYTALSRLELSGGSIVVIAVNAAFLAAAEGGPVTMGLIARSARGEFRKHDSTFQPDWE